MKVKGKADEEDKKIYLSTTLPIKRSYREFSLHMVVDRVILQKTEITLHPSLTFLYLKQVWDT